MKKILSVCLVIALLICVTACGASKPNGRYDIDSMDMEGTKMTADQLKAFGMEMYIIFNSDGTGTLGYGTDDEAETESFTWTENKLIDETGDEIEYTFDGTSVTLSEDGTSIVFK